MQFLQGIKGAKALVALSVLYAPFAAFKNGAGLLEDLLRN